MGSMLRLLHETFPKNKDTENIHKNEFELYLTKEFIELGFFEKSKEVDEKMGKLGILNFSEQAEKTLKKSYELFEKNEELGKLFKNESREYRIHGDYHVGNTLVQLIDGKYDIKLIDWETSRFGSIYEDLAKFIVSGLLDEENEIIFLDGYTGKSDFEVNKKILYLFKIRTIAHMISFFIHTVSKVDVPIYALGLKIYFSNFQKLLEKL